MSKLHERFGNALHGTAHAWRQSMDHRLKHLGVSHSSGMAIAMAADAPEPLSQSELADRLGIEGATLVAMIDRLVKAGWVIREPSTRDRRINHIVVTEAGQRLSGVLRAEATAVRTDLLANIDTQKLATATDVLEALQRMIATSP
jgi:MarR family transcriptional regulator, transcriptional regulator for hemolysin